MEIQNTLLQGLLQTVTDGLQQPHKDTLPQSLEPALGQVEVMPERRAGPEEAPDLAQAVQTGDSSGILTTGEKEIIELFFNGQEGVDLLLYGHQPQKPALLGNFVDVRG